ncbi:MAG: hypothetical protein IPM99_19055 [Rubrivivax sp.]|nr:hypothetical protein [Rubrivivax sp.]
MKTMKIMAWLLAMLLAGLYLVQYVWAGMDKGQPQARGEALWRIAQPRLQRLVLPYGMTARVIGVLGGRSTCPWINFQQLWGRCAIVTIDLLDAQGVREDEFVQLTRRLSMELTQPCQFLQMTGPTDKDYRILECAKNSTIQLITTRVFLIVPGPGGLDNVNHPTMWNRRLLRSLAVYTTKGEI